MSTRVPPTPASLDQPGTRFGNRLENGMACFGESHKSRGNVSWMGNNGRDRSNGPAVGWRPFFALLISATIRPPSSPRTSCWTRRSASRGPCFPSSGAPGFVIAAVRDGETAFAGFGETVTRSGKEPDADTLMRIGSITKVFCGERWRASWRGYRSASPTDSQDRLGPEAPCRRRTAGPIRLIDLVTHASGLPREVPTDPTPGPGRSVRHQHHAAQIAALQQRPAAVRARHRRALFQLRLRPARRRRWRTPPASPTPTFCPSACLRPSA